MKVTFTDYAEHNECDPSALADCWVCVFVLVLLNLFFIFIRKPFYSLKEMIQD